MKILLTLAVAAACGLTAPSSGSAQDGQLQAGSQGLAITTSSQFRGSGSDAYGRRLNRFQNNYGYNNGRNRQYRNSSQRGYRNHDYYGGNYNRVRDYRNHYRSHPNRGYNYGYYSRPGFSIGGGSSRIFFGF